MARTSWPRAVADLVGTGSGDAPGSIGVCWFSRLGATARPAPIAARAPWRGLLQRCRPAFHDRRAGATGAGMGATARPAGRTAAGLPLRRAGLELRQHPA